MEGDQRWQAYVRGELEPRNAEENVFSWKCGRPTVHEPGGAGRLAVVCHAGCTAGLQPWLWWCNLLGVILLS